MAEKLTYTYNEGPYTPEQSAEDFKEHDSTYKLFIRLAKWGIGVLAVILILLYIFLVA